MLRRLTLIMATVVVSLTLTEASEAGGLFLTEIGTEDVALAGTGWAARAQDAVRSPRIRKGRWTVLIQASQA